MADSANSSSIDLEFPDGSVRSFEGGTTGYAIAEGISKSLSKKAVACTLNGDLIDLSEPIQSSGKIEIVTRTDERALELIRHDCAHVLAEAVQEIWPDTKVSIGPVIQNGFYYDFDRAEPFTPEDLVVIEKKMAEIIRRNQPFTREVVSREHARDLFEQMGEPYKVELLDAIPEGEDVKLYRQGEWTDLCRGPHMPATGHIGNSFKLMSVAGAYWRGDSNNQMLSRIYGTAWADDKQLKNYLH
ncbi:MAG: TGS domain-containing protein, partial [Pseudomonadota bacterium]